MAAPGFRKPLGPYAVSFGDLELPPTWRPKGDALSQQKSSVTEQKISIEAQVVSAVLEGRPSKAPHQSPASGPNGTATTAPGLEPLPDVPAPLVRVFYPATPESARKASSHPGSRWYGPRNWLTHVTYSVGYFVGKLAPFETQSKLSLTKRVLAWVVGALLYLLSATIDIAAWPLLPLINARADGPPSQLPVVVVSHGLMAMRTSITALTCDLASHGYVVFAIEHREGSACATHFTDKDDGGRKRRTWIGHLGKGFGPSLYGFRYRQMMWRIAEITSVLDTLALIQRGALPTSLNRAWDSPLDVGQFKGRLDLDHAALAGHSFGAATVIATAAREPRFKAHVVLDAWLDVLRDDDYTRHGGDSPMLLLNAEGFSWKELNENRARLLEARREAEKKQGVVTDTHTIKDAVHYNQTDLPIAWGPLLKSLGAGKMGDVDAQLAQDASSRTCLEFLYRHVLPKESSPVFNVARTPEDNALFVQPPKAP